MLLPAEGWEFGVVGSRLKVLVLDGPEVKRKSVNLKKKVGLYNNREC
jgi:hypothetical protein